MTLDIFLKDVVVSQYDHDKIRKKLNKTLQRYPKPLTVHLTFSEEKNQWAICPECTHCYWQFE